MRTAAGVIAGYVVMALTLFVVFTVVYQIVGTEGSFKPGLFEPSTLWVVQSFVVGLVAAVIGGWVCATIAKSPRAIPILAILVVVFGIASAIGMAVEEHEPGSEVRTGELDGVEAMTQTRTPMWIAILNPVVGLVGVILGGRLKKQ